MDAVTSPARNRLDPVRLLIGLAPVGVIGFVASYAGIAMINRENGVAPIWIANAFLIYFALRSPRDIFCARLRPASPRVFWRDWQSEARIVSATVFSLCNLAEVLIVALPLRALNADQDFSRPKPLLAFYVLAAVGPVPSRHIRRRLCACPAPHGLHP